MADLESDTRRSKTKKGGKSIKKNKKDKGDGAIQDWKLPDKFGEDYGVPTDIGKRLVNFSDVDKSVYNGITEVPYTKSPWNYIFASKFDK